MKLNHNNRDIDIDYKTCSNCYFNGRKLCAVLPDPCWIGGHTYKISTKNSSIFRI